MLESSAAALSEAVPGLAVTGLWGRYEAGLDRLAADREPVVVAFLGSNLGNTTPAECDALLARIPATLRLGDGFLVSVDLLKPVAAFDACCNDPPGHSAFAQFRLNHLAHLNRRFGATFDLSRFRPHAFYRPAEEVVEGHVTALDDQHVAIPGLGMHLDLRRGDAINVGFSAKFDRDRFVADLASHGLAPQAQWEPRADDRAARPTPFRRRGRRVRGGGCGSRRAR